MSGQTRRGKPDSHLSVGSPPAKTRKHGKSGLGLSCLDDARLEPFPKHKSNLVPENSTRSLVQHGATCQISTVAWKWATPLNKNHSNIFQHKIGDHHGITMDPNFQLQLSPHLGGQASVHGIGILRTIRPPPWIAAPSDKRKRCQQMLPGNAIPVRILVMARTSWPNNILNCRLFWHKTSENIWKLNIASLYLTLSHFPCKSVKAWYLRPWCTGSVCLSSTPSGGNSHSSQLNQTGRAKADFLSSASSNLTASHTHFRWCCSCSNLSKCRLSQGSSYMAMLLEHPKATYG